MLPQLRRGPVITTNFDRVLETVFKQARTPLEGPLWGAQPDSAIDAFHANRPFLLKIHGDADERGNRILTRGEYEQHLLLGLMMTSRPLLFLGCSLNRDRTLAVLERIATKHPSIAHYAVVEQPVSADLLYERARFLSNHGIRPIWYPSGRHDLIEPLLESLVPLAITPRRRRAPNTVPRRRMQPSVTDTDPVRFRTERVPRELDLDRAVHRILDEGDSNATFHVPLEYDDQVLRLVEKIQLLFDDFESLMERHDETGSPAKVDEYSYVRSTLRNARELLQTLPRTVGLAIARLCRARLEMSDVFITRTASRLLELAMAQLIAGLAKFQFESDTGGILLPYARQDSRDKLISLIDGVPLEKLVSYRIQLVGDSEDRIVLAPLEYGSRRLLLLHEFDRMGLSYVPPISFVTDYLFPQMFWWSEPEKWNVEWKCQSVFAKGLDGNYLDLSR